MASDVRQPHQFAHNRLGGAKPTSDDLEAQPAPKVVLLVPQSCDLVCTGEEISALVA
jgi:hypothetical protein